METLLAHAQGVVYTLVSLMPTLYQQESLQTLFGLFLQAQGHPLPQHTRAKSASALSRFFNEYNWSTKKVICATRSAVLQQILSQRRVGRRPVLQVILELYQHASSLTQGKKDIEFKKKPELALALVDRSLERGYRPGIVLMDAGYGNNTTFLLELENRRLKYLGGLAKNRKVSSLTQANNREEIRLDELAKSLPVEAFTPVQLNKEKSKTVWVATVEVELSRLEETRTINAPGF